MLHGTLSLKIHRHIHCSRRDVVNKIYLLRISSEYYYVPMDQRYLYISVYCVEMLTQKKQRKERKNKKRSVCT